MKPLCVVQARRDSTRLPGKVLLDLAGEPVLLRLVERLGACRQPLDVVVATTTQADDDGLATLCLEAGIAVFRGHPTDLLDRHYQAARAHGARVVLKVPSDCPLIDPEAVDLALATFLAEPGRHDYVSNLHPESWPDGNDVEVFSFAALETAWREAREPWEREHTTPFLWDRPERFRLGNVLWPGGRDLSRELRFTLDYGEDYLFVAAVYEALWRPEQPVFPLHAVLDLLRHEPGLAALNAAHRHTQWYRREPVPLRTAWRGVPTGTGGAA